MRPKKSAPPSSPTPTSATPAAPTEAEVNERKTVLTLLGVLSQVLPSGTAITTSDLKDACSMFLCVMHMLPVSKDYFVEKHTLVLSIHAKAAQIAAENALLKVDGLSDQAKSTINAAIELSVNEIGTLRDTLAKELVLLKQVPTKFATKH